MTTASATPVLANGLYVLEFSRGTTTKLLDAIPEDKRMYQPIEACNHVVWIVGHLAVTDDIFRSKLTETEPGVPEAWNGLFGMGSETSSDPSAYPAWDELYSAFEGRRVALIEWLSGLSDEELATPLPEDWSSFAPNLGALMSGMGAHEMMHVGQILMIRKALKLPYLFS